MACSYTVMHAHNCETKHWRGLLCGYAVMRITHVHVCAGMQAGACACVHVQARTPHNRVIA